VAECDELGLGDGSGGRGAGTGVEEAELAKHLARAQDGQEVLAAVDAGTPELDLALADHVEPIPTVAFAKEDVAALEVRSCHRLHQGPGGLVVQGSEERGSSYDVDVHGAQSARARRFGGLSTTPISLTGCLRP